MLAVGITAIGSGIGQPVLDSLRDSSLKVRIVGFEANPWAKGAYECDAAYRLPLANNPDYTSTLLARCEEASLDALIPGSDPELIALAEAAPALESLGCIVVVSAPECVRVCRDKLALCNHLTRAGVPFVSTWPLETARARADDLSYPLILKPRGGSGSTGVQVLCHSADWERIHCQGDWIVQSYLTPAAWHESPEGIEPYLDQLTHAKRPLQRDELSIQVMVSETGKLLGRFASLNRLKDGVPMQLDPIDDERIWAETEKFVSALVPLGLKGPCNLQGRITQQGIQFFEANPRFTGISHVRALMDYNEVEAALRHFVLKQDEETVRRCLKTRTDRVGLRQMTESAVPRQRLYLFQERGKLSDPPPFELALITGATGYLGYTLTRTLLEKNLVKEIIAPVRNPDRARALWDDSPFADRFRFVSWEMPGLVPGLEEADLVIHAAAIRPTASADPMAWYRMNVSGTLNIVNAARRARVSNLIFMSSQQVYGVQQPPLWAEENSLCPDTPYAHSKAAGEAVVQTLNNSSTRWAILRMARLYGLSPYARWEELPHRFASLTAKGGILPVYGDGHQRMDLLHVRDAADFLVQLLRKSPAGWNQAYNLGSGQPISINELAETCVAIAKAEGWPEPTIEHKPGTSSPPSLGMDIGKARRVLGWAPKVSLATALSELIHYARKERFPNT